jgi:hypothetical protein
MVIASLARHRHRRRHDGHRRHHHLGRRDRLHRSRRHRHLDWIVRACRQLG